ncbi:hypothetical protein TRSC58_00336 [Trypanosoma rangeli SC58]|uniref:Guanine nucleotide-binding protein subunit beta-like protein n=1 Tax=Trypanosoma rangeli SC58 TaxID=429131 RepID=A0A061JC08_TRYRA|nr:hypothetical protein TRSC58_00336 [Trypanosoma rangeli SC58]
MTLSATRGAIVKHVSDMSPVESFKCGARCCCVAGDAVWVAELKGGIAVCDAQRGNVLERVVVGEGDQRVHFKSMALVHGEVWAGTTTGVVHVFDAPGRRWKQSMTILGVEATASLLSLFFDGLSVLGGSETGRIVQWNPFTKKQVAVFVALAPVTAVTVAAGFIVSGDRSGVVQLWDPRSGEVVCEHTQDAFAVTSLLAETSTETLWVGRRNGTVSVYALAATMSFTGRLSVGDGAVTSMLAVSGKVLVTSYDRAIVVFAAKTREELSRAKLAHDAFIHYASRVYAAETARIWTIGNDGVVHVWDVAGYFLPCQSPPSIRPCDQAAMVHDARGALTIENAELTTRVAESLSRVADVKEELRQAKDEAHEMRLRLISFEHLLKEKDAEIASRAARVKELEEDVNKLRKTVTDSNARADAAQRETNMLRADYHTALQDASQTKTQLSAKIAEKASVEQRLLSVRTENSHLEIRLRDREGEVAQLKAENARLHGAVGQFSSTQSAERELHLKLLANTEGAMRQELDELRKRCKVLGGMLVSMEYTIRRKEEEERDMTALMNALRRRAAESVTDPHLAALLNLTMMRNPDRFEMQCDEHTKSLLRDRNGPFIQFLQALHDRDPRTYEQLLAYLQHPEAGSRFGPLLDQLLGLAQREGAGSGDDIVSFKKSLPVLLDLLNGMNAAGTRVEAGGASGGATLAMGAGGATVNSSLSPTSATDAKQAVVGLGNAGPVGGSVGVCPAGGNAATLNATAAQRPSQQQQQTAVGALEVGDAGRILPTDIDEFKSVLRNMNITVELPDFVGMGAVGAGEDGHLKQLRNAFEFILQTRRDLVQKMGILLKRIVKARQVIDALTSNARESSLSTHRHPSGSVGAHVGRHNLGSVATNMLEELQRIVLGILAVYFTAAEKQRLGVDA